MGKDWGGLGKDWGGLGKDWGGLGKNCILWQKANFRGQKKMHHGVGCRTVLGLKSLAFGRGFADDLAVSTATPAGLQKIPDVIFLFCQWAGMRLKMAKSEVTAFDYSRRTDLPTNCIRYNGEALVCLPAHGGQGGTIRWGARGQAPARRTRSGM